MVASLLGSLCTKGCDCSNETKKQQINSEVDFSCVCCNGNGESPRHSHVSHVADQVAAGVLSRLSHNIASDRMRGNNILSKDDLHKIDQLFISGLGTFSRSIQARIGELLLKKPIQQTLHSLLWTAKSFDFANEIFRVEDGSNPQVGAGRVLFTLAHLDPLEQQDIRFQFIKCFLLICHFFADNEIVLSKSTVLIDGEEVFNNTELCIVRDENPLIILQGPDSQISCIYNNRTVISVYNFDEINIWQTLLKLVWSNLSRFPDDLVQKFPQDLLHKENLEFPANDEKKQHSGMQ